LQGLTPLFGNLQPCFDCPVPPALGNHSPAPPVLSS
jgi:hypothetical protein